MADRVGEQLGNYRLLKLIGRGGFADVYLGEHVRLGNQAAIKVLQTRLENEDILAFQQEARTIGRLAHPNIVRVFDFAVQDGVPFLAMDYAPNGTLRQRYARGMRVPLETVIVYVKQVADALQYAHEQKVIHRDVKPENMLVGRLDDILLSDFGIAVVSQSSRHQTSSEMVGTVGYMAPEQIQGHPRPASDQYALGIVVYEWLCGERPFNGGVTEVATQQLIAPPPPLRARVPTLAPAVEDAVMTALAKDPNQRFGSVRAFAAALENAAHAQPSIYSLSTQLSTPVIPPPPQPGAPVTPSAPPAGAPGNPNIPSQGYGSTPSQAYPSTPFAPTVAGSLPASSVNWSNAETVRGSQPVGSQPFGGSQGFDSQAYGSGFQGAGGSQGFGAPSQPWGYGAPSGPPAGLPPPPPIAPQSGMYTAPVAPVLTAPPPKTRRVPVLWIAVALVVLVLGGGGAVFAFSALTALHPVISVTSSHPGSPLGGPPDTVLHVNGQQFSSNSTITFLLDGSPAPGAQLAQSDGNGAFKADVTITDDWTFDTHTLTAKDAKGNVTQSGVPITVTPQPVLEVQSQYHAGSTPAGADKTTFTISGKRFAPNATVTFLLDGKQVPGSHPTPTDARGRVQTTLEVTGDWTLGSHQITAQDDKGNSTQGGVPLVIVHAGEDGTPGPNGAPPDNANFTLFVTVKPNGRSSFTYTLTISNGKVCENEFDTGETLTNKHTFSDGTSYTETFTLKCSGTYKAGHLVYTETITRDTYDLSDGGFCVGNTPRTNVHLDGHFSGPGTISGRYTRAADNVTCPRINTFYLLPNPAETGTWIGNT